MRRNRGSIRSLARVARQGGTAVFGVVILGHLPRRKRGRVAVVEVHEIRLPGGCRLVRQLVNGAQHVDMADDFPLH